MSVSHRDVLLDDRRNQLPSQARTTGRHRHRAPRFVRLPAKPPWRLCHRFSFFLVLSSSRKSMFRAVPDTPLPLLSLPCHARQKRVIAPKKTNKKKKESQRRCHVALYANRSGVVWKGCGRDDQPAWNNNQKTTRRRTPLFADHGFAAGLCLITNRAPLCRVRWSRDLTNTTAR